MVSNEVLQNAVDLIDRSGNILITSHTRPDGDACGSVRAMCDILESLGKKVSPIFMSPLPEWYDFLFDKKVPILSDDISVEQLHDGHFDECDLVIIVDTNSYIQLPVFDEWLKQNDTPVLVIDHHITGDELGDVEVIDTTAAAAGEIVFDLINYANWPITEKIAEAIFVAVATDSGWFKFTNADQRIFLVAAELIEAGASPSGIYSKLYQNVSPARMRLMIRMLNSMVLLHNNQIAFQHIMRSDFDETGATGRDTENLIDECQRIGSVEMAAIFVELADGGFRCSLRSKGKVDVQVIARSYGGGGHKMASGVTLPGPLDTAKEMIAAPVIAQLG
ncbi:MAG: bifunctional oligoribonuclease/PAP phosphatase NrnA [Planctomycetes bacterium]|nr:bifunctional oligoribonuclease/PAP phosphatase NrnA [Planctomycetota bacterium]